MGLEQNRANTGYAGPQLGKALFGARSRYIIDLLLTSSHVIDYLIPLMASHTTEKSESLLHHP